MLSSSQEQFNGTLGTPLNPLLSRVVVLVLWRVWQAALSCCLCNRTFFHNMFNTVLTPVLAGKQKVAFSS